MSNSLLSFLTFLKTIDSLLFGQFGQNMAGDDLVFSVNGEKFEVLSVDPWTTLLEFLRSNTLFKSVKLSCGEGTYTHCNFSSDILLSFY